MLNRFEWNLHRILFKFIIFSIKCDLEPVPVSESPGEVNLWLIRLEAQGDEGPLRVQQVKGGGVIGDGVLGAGVNIWKNKVKHCEN